jgi:nondiscriminating glutamyl-tRNA synthetase
MIKTRFAPSPTGYVHVGSLRAALFPYLFARKTGGKFVLRVEDTDQTRLVDGAVENLLQMLAWVGITPDEGPIFNENGHVHQIGDCGPYIQSERLPLYQKEVQTLLANGSAYYAFDSSEELEEMRKTQEVMKQSPRYDRANMKNQFTLGEEETQKRLASGQEYVIRLKVPDEGEVIFTDIIRGEVRVKVCEIDDQVLMKSDGYPTYHLAVVVDDHAMNITHIIRGEDWLPSTPKHVLLFNAFGWEVPALAHMPLLVNHEKQKLSKRKGDVSVESFKEKGYLPEAFINFLAFLGWNPGDDREIFSMSELIEAFSLEKVQRSAAVFNIEKLNWYNKEYIKQMDISELTKRCIPYLVNAGLIKGDEPREFLEAVVALEKERMTVLSELSESVGFIFAEHLEYDPALVIWKKDTREGTKEKLGLLAEFLDTIDASSWDLKTLDEKIKNWITEKGFGVGDVLWPMRVSLSGRQNSPGPFEIASVLGKEKTLKRIKFAAEQL